MIVANYQVKSIFGKLEDVSFEADTNLENAKAALRQLKRGYIAGYFMVIHVDRYSLHWEDTDDFENEVITISETSKENWHDVKIQKMSWDKGRKFILDYVKE